MKNLFLGFVAIAMIFASCSKEYTLNNQLNGSWDLSTYDGNAVTSGFKTLAFTKASDTKGTLVITTAVFGITTTESGSYVLESDTKITFTPSGAANVQVYTVVAHSSSSLTLQDANAHIWVLIKK